MIKDRDIIIVGIQPWDIEIGSNCKNIALEFAKNNRVLYVNPPMDRFTRFKHRNRERVQKRIQIAFYLISQISPLTFECTDIYARNS